MVRIFIKSKEKMSKGTVKTKSESTEVVEKKLTAKDMVFEALTELNDRNGTSFFAIKKYIVNKHPNVDLIHWSTYLKKFIKSSIENGSVKQTKGSAGSIGGENFVKFERKDGVHVVKRQNGRLIIVQTYS